MGTKHPNLSKWSPPLPNRAQMVPRRGRDGKTYRKQKRCNKKKGCRTRNKRLKWQPRTTTLKIRCVSFAPNAAPGGSNKNYVQLNLHVPYTYPTRTLHLPYTYPTLTLHLRAPWFHILPSSFLVCFVSSLSLNRTTVRLGSRYLRCLKRQAAGAVISSLK